MRYLAFRIVRPVALRATQVGFSEYAMRGGRMNCSSAALWLAIEPTTAALAAPSVVASVALEAVLAACTAAGM